MAQKDASMGSPEVHGVADLPMMVELRFFVPHISFLDFAQGVQALGKPKTIMVNLPDEEHQYHIGQFNIPGELPDQGNFELTLSVRTTRPMTPQNALAAIEALEDDSRPAYPPGPTTEGIDAQGNHIVTYHLGKVLGFKLFRSTLHGSPATGVDAFCHHFALVGYLLDLVKEMRARWPGLILQTPDPDPRGPNQVYDNLIRALAQRGLIEASNSCNLFGEGAFYRRETILLGQTTHKENTFLQFAQWLATTAKEVILRRFPGAEHYYLTLDPPPRPEKMTQVEWFEFKSVMHFVDDESVFHNPNWAIRVRLEESTENGCPVIVECREPAVEPYFEELVQRIRERWEPKELKLQKELEPSQAQGISSYWPGKAKVDEAARGRKRSYSPRSDTLPRARKALVEWLDNDKSKTCACDFAGIDAKTLTNCIAQAVESEENEETRARWKRKLAAMGITLEQ